MVTPHPTTRRSLVLMSLLMVACTAWAQLTSWVDPFIGTGAAEASLSGNNYPGPTLPFGFVQLSPDTREAPNWDCNSGYDYNDHTLYGFSHTHLSGTGASDLIDILLLPTSKGERHSEFSHEGESARPGYYRVRLTDDDILAELTATMRTGVHRYTYSKGSAQCIFLDLDHSASKDSWGRRIEKAQLRIVDAYTVEGYRIITGWAPLRKVCFSICFSKPIVSYGLWCDGRWFESASNPQGDMLTFLGGMGETYNGTDIKGTFTFANESPASNPSIPIPNPSNLQVEARVGLSAVSIENARENRIQETEGKGFDQLQDNADAEWEKVLCGIRANFLTKEESTIFYTALYHAMQQPNTFSDVNGQYARANYEIGKVPEGHDFYTTFSIWDTYRGAHALYCLLQPARTADMVNSMLDHAETYGYLPIWELWGEDNYCMIGNHAVSIVVEAIVKNVPGIDKRRAWRAVRQTLTTPHRDSPWPLWEKLGYMPENLQTQSVSITLEDSYDAWCAARLAEICSQTEVQPQDGLFSSHQLQSDIERFQRLSRNYRNLYNKESGYFQPKDDKGQWLPDFDPLRYGANGGSAFTEGNAAQWRWSVQHDVEDLIALGGGQKYFLDQLDYFFTCKETSGQKNDNASGFVGLYAHGNEPSHHVSFLYTLAGQPWKTDQLVNHIRSTLYNISSSGYAGNDDCGEMSAWYIFAALGLYPINPASGQYVLFAPSVTSAIIPLPNGRVFRVETNRRSDKDIYVKSIRWNGQKLNIPSLSHSQILSGGTLRFELTHRPGGNLVPISTEKRN